MAVLALVTPLSLAAKHQRIDAIQTTATVLATQRMERLGTLAFDDVLAAHGTSETGTNITGFDGAALNDATLDRFTLSISVEQVTLIAGDEADSFAAATVTVTHPEVADVSVARLFANGN